MMPFVKLIQERVLRQFGEVKSVPGVCNKDPQGNIWPPREITVTIRCAFSVEELRQAGVQVDVMLDGRKLSDDEYAQLLIAAERKASELGLTDAR
jgi:hypothetical protein